MYLHGQNRVQNTWRLAQARVSYRHGPLVPLEGVIVNSPSSRSGHRSADCSYVLTRELAARNFTLLGASDAVTLLTPDGAVTIDATHRVRVNNSLEYR